MDKTAGVTNGEGSTVKVSTTELIQAVGTVQKRILDAQKQFAALSEEQRQRAPNKSSILALEHRIETLDLLTKIVSFEVCCDTQTQNCEFDIDRSE